MKKIKLLMLVCFSSLLLGTGFISCSNGVSSSGDDDEETPASTRPATTEEEEAPAHIDGVTSQAEIDRATAGSTITLDSDFSASSISINKALTVNGSGVANLTINVASNVTSNVTLRNFRNAVIVVAAPSSTHSSIGVYRSARSAGGMYRGANAGDPVVSSTADEGYKKVGEDSLPLHIEGCTIEKLDVKDDVALYLGTDEKKSVINNLNLKEGVEDFTFIEFDKSDKPETTADEKTPLANKSEVKILKLEDDGIEKINLIGGTFDDINYANDFSGNVDFKYDKEFADQLNLESAKKEAFMNAFEPKDIGVAEKTDSEKEYIFTIPKEYFENIDGRFAIVFMTDEQKTDISTTQTAQNTTDSLHPIYGAFPTGGFKIDYEGNVGSYKTIYGSESAYLNYANAISRGLQYCEAQDVVVLEKYRNYNKEAFVAEITQNEIIIHVNMDKVRKEDVLICSYHGEDAFGEAGTKLSEINLDGYKPYIYAYWMDYQMKFNQEHGIISYDDYVTAAPEYDDNGPTGEYATQLAAYREAAEQQNALYEAGRAFVIDTAITRTGASEPEPVETWIPYGDSLKMQWEFRGTLTPMTARSGSYPPVDNVEYTKIDISAAGRAWAQELVRMFSNQ